MGDTKLRPKKLNSIYGASSLRVVLRARIAALEDVLDNCVEINDAGQKATFSYIQGRIAAMQKEIESE